MSKVLKPFPEPRGPIWRRLSSAWSGLSFCLLRRDMVRMSRYYAPIPLDQRTWRDLLTLNSPWIRFLSFGDDCRRRGWCDSPQSALRPSY